MLIQSHSNVKTSGGPACFTFNTSLTREGGRGGGGGWGGGGGGGKVGVGGVGGGGGDLGLHDTARRV